MALLHWKTASRCSRKLAMAASGVLFWLEFGPPVQTLPVEGRS